MAKRGWWLGLGLVAGACSRGEPEAEPPEVEAEPAAETRLRPVLEVLPDGTMITKRRPIYEPEPSAEAREAAEAFLAERGRELSELELSASDRALLAEYAAIKALYAQNSAAGNPREAAAPAAAEPAIEGALFGLETRDHRLWLLRSAAGKRYTVTAKDGTVVAEEIDAAALERDYPDLHALVHEAVDLIAD